MALCGLMALAPGTRPDGRAPPSYSFSLKTQTPKPGRTTGPLHPPHERNPTQKGASI